MEDQFDRLLGRFTWIRPSGRFSLEKGSTTLLWKGTRPFHEYEPLKYDAMFYTFSETALDAESICNFATKFGPLESCDAPFKTRLDGGVLADWFHDIHEMHTFVDFWNSVVMGYMPDFSFDTPFEFDGVHISGTFRSDPRLDKSDIHAQTYFNEYPDGIIDDWNYEGIEELLRTEELTWDEVMLKFTDSILKQAVAKKLQELCVPNFTLDGEIKLYPKNLLGMMWVQFAEAIEREDELFQCAYEGCINWYLNDGVADQFCSETCARYARKK